jgi:hypothetical protein
MCQTPKSIPGCRAEWVREAASGVSADGTPFADLEVHRRELMAEVAALKKRLRSIAFLCNTPGWNAEKRREIRAITEGKMS